MTLKEANAKSVQVFEARLPHVQEIIIAERLFGDPDYVLHVHVVTKDLPAFQALSL
ncbi:hypothetical protein [Caballeronia arvi]|uniref:hypothetical protein n=1 Tax=Caballeronia arvi TaxID=1777135 RepID=UPI000A5BADD1|nr:hypothetical protein [Caballeronia arvi]